MIAEEIKKLIEKALESLGIQAGEFVLEHPVDIKNGDYSTSVAIKHGHKYEILEYLQKYKPDEVEKIELAGPGFINFYLSKEFFKNSIGEIIKDVKNFGKSKNLKGEKIMVEHTDPNPFKEFHIGHLMPNVIGSTLARVFEWNGAEVKQVNYQGDIGLHVAKTIWVLNKEKILPKDIVLEKLAHAYTVGSKSYEDQKEENEIKTEIHEINRKIYDKSDLEINKLYEIGRKVSLEEFERIYKKLGTKFDYYFFESEVADVGVKIVRNNPSVFVDSQGAVIFDGSRVGFHIRVFINSKGLPTYETKELGLAKLKAKKYSYTKSIIVTGNEIKDYFDIIFAAMRLVPELKDLVPKNKHICHGMLRLPSGKMSSRTGDVITAEALIEEVKKKVKGDEAVAIGAIKYMILRQAIGNNIIFDIDKSVSTEGDSGVYLQYAYARTNSLLEKAKMLTLGVNKNGQGDKIRGIERLLYRFPEVVERAGKEYAPHHITTYLTQLASSFNNFYAHEQVIGDSKESSYRLAIVKAFNIVMKNGLEILGMPAPERL